MATKMNPAFKAMIEKKKAGAKPAAKMAKMASGGMTRADGCVSKGHTKGKMVKMAGGDLMMARGGKTMMARGGMTMMRGGGVKKMRG